MWSIRVSIFFLDIALMQVRSSSTDLVPIPSSAGHHSRVSVAFLGLLPDILQEKRLGGRGVSFMYRVQDMGTVKWAKSLDEVRGWEGMGLVTRP
jgi:hypothetical protein